jgi:hypothetical protein
MEKGEKAALPQLPMVPGHRPADHVGGKPPSQPFSKWTFLAPVSGHMMPQWLSYRVTMRYSHCPPRHARSIL